MELCSLHAHTTLPQQVPEEDTAPQLVVVPDCATTLC